MKNLNLNKPAIARIPLHRFVTYEKKIAALQQDLENLEQIIEQLDQIDEETEQPEQQ